MTQFYIKSSIITVVIHDLRYYKNIYLEYTAIFYTTWIHHFPYIFFIYILKIFRNLTDI